MKKTIGRLGEDCERVADAMKELDLNTLDGDLVLDFLRCQAPLGLGTVAITLTTESTTSDHYAASMPQEAKAKQSGAFRCTTDPPTANQIAQNHGQRRRKKSARAKASCAAAVFPI